jgi:hypothetical protein
VCFALTWPRRCVVRMMLQWSLTMMTLLATIRQWRRRRGWQRQRRRRPVVV